MNSWNGLDFFIFLIFVVNTLMGASRGASKEIISMMCLSIGLIFMIKFTVPLAVFFNSSPLINDVVDNNITRNFMIAIGANPLTVGTLQQIFYSISLLLCFMGAYSFCEATLTYSGFVEFFSFPWAALNRKLGAALGCTRGYVFNLILLVILSLHLAVGNNGQVIQDEFLSGSFFARLFKTQTERMDSLITGQRPGRFREIYRGKDLYNVEKVYKQLNTEQQSNTEQQLYNQFKPNPTQLPNQQQPSQSAPQQQSIQQQIYQ